MVFMGSKTILLSRTFLKPFVNFTTSDKKISKLNADSKTHVDRIIYILLQVERKYFSTNAIPSHFKTQKKQ